MKRAFELELEDFIESHTGDYLADYRLATKETAEKLAIAYEKMIEAQRKFKRTHNIETRSGVSKWYISDYKPDRYEKLRETNIDTELTSSIWYDELNQLVKGK